MLVVFEICSCHPRREDFPCAFRLDVCSKNHTWEGGWRDAKYIVAASSAIHIEKWNTEVQATVQVPRTLLSLLQPRGTATPVFY